MKILHICICGSFLEGCNYQDNALTRQNIADGHDVLVITSIIESKGKPIGKVYENEDGVKILRLPYKKYLLNVLTHKIRKVPGLSLWIEKFEPNIILFHGTSSYEIKTVVKYKRNHPETILYMDNHADYHNSATNILSRVILHKFYYRNLIKDALPYMEKLLCLSLECKEFAHEMYKVPEEKLEFYPLGGDIYEGDQYKQMRKLKRDELEIKDDEILFLHTGNMNKIKRTLDLLEAFSDYRCDKFKLVLIGLLDEKIKAGALQLIDSDERISFLGWKDGKELMSYLCATDVYMQPGSQSATMQNAMCCSCAMVLYPYSSHSIYLKNKDFFVTNKNDIKRILKLIEENPMIVDKQKDVSNKIAHNILDYRKLAARIYQ